ncbi:TRAP transporter solute receptor, unknown substrate 7 [plant metagenome]|uniref:TRAP-type C4-dicarboxylate transport system, periplasmic component n=1 Tax=plant metagenome TaxID=1297885 RepID=A0A484UX49_9ZZZZ
MKKTYKKLLPTALVLAAMLGIAPAHAQGDTKAELIAMAKEMKPFSMRVLGPPVGTAEWVFVVQPFWTQAVKEISDGKVTATLNSVTDISAQPQDALQLVSQGTFDMTNMVANYGSGDVPTLDGFDLAGAATSTEQIKKVLAAYEPAADAALKKRYRLELLGAGMSGAQTFFCKGNINTIEDFRGKKIRVSSSTLAELVKGLGAAPVTMAFGELVPALQRGVIDCVITGSMSGNTAKLYEVADTLYFLIAGWAPTVQVANARSLSRLDEKQRAWLDKAMTYYYREVSDTVQTSNVNQGVWCNTADARCNMVGQSGVTQGKMKLVEPSQEDLAKVREVVEKFVLPAYGRTCGADCTRSWNETAGKAIDMQISTQ